jgi:hypothetical protein
MEFAQISVAKNLRLDLPTLQLVKNSPPHTVRKCEVLKTVLRHAKEEFHNPA